MKNLMFISCREVAVTPLIFFFLAITRPVSAEVMEEIIVTAQKREQNIQDVGVSVTAFSGDQIRELGFTQSTDIATQTPNVLFSETESASSRTVPSIRGVSQNDTSQMSASPIATYIDGVYMSFNHAYKFAMYDMERIEVLRGPQGTLFGISATGGLIHYVTRKPTDTFEAYADLTIGEYNQVSSEAAVSGPLNNQLSGRLSINTGHYDGWMENRIGDDTFNRDSYAARGQVLFKPTNDLEILVGINVGTENNDTGAYHHTAATQDQFGRGVDIPRDVDLFGLGPGTSFWGYVDPDEDLHVGSFDDIGFLERDMYGVSGTITWDFDRFILTSITGYNNFKFDYLEDSDGTPLKILEFGQGLDRGEQWTQELRLQGETERLRWTAGLYYLTIDIGEAFDSIAVPILAGTPDAFNVESQWTSGTESWAVYGQVEYDLTSQWTVIAGLRWSDNEKTFEGSTTAVDFPSAGPPGTIIYDFSEATVGALTKQEVGDYSAKGELDWRPTDDLMLYAGITRGHKGPGFNVPLDGSVTNANTPYGPEVLTNYEFGWKSTLFNGTTRFNGAVFYYDYTDFQSFNLIGLAQVISNRDAEIYGAEFELVTHPAEGWDFVFGLSLLHPEVFDVALPDGITTADNVPPQAPTLTANGLARKEWPAFGGTLAVQMDFNYVGDYQSGISNAPATDESEYVIGNGRLSYTSADERWQAALFVKNIANADIQIYTYDVSSIGFNNHSILPPRWIGGQFSYRWK